MNTQNQLLGHMAEAVHTVTRDLDLVGQRLLAMVPSMQSIEAMRASRLRLEATLRSLASA